MTRPREPQSTPEPALRGGSWTVLSRVFVQLVQFAIFIFAAQLLQPEEFGVFALVAAFVVILNQLAMAGWPEYIMQCEDDVYRLRSALFVAMSGGAVTVALGISVSFLFLATTDNTTAIWVGQILAVSVFFTSTGAAYSGVLNHQNRLTAAALAVMAAEAVNLVVAVWALYAGYGILALAYGRLANSLLWCLATAAATRLLPTRHIGFDLLKEMAEFSRHIIATRILVNLRIYAATFIIGGFVGAAAVGYYRAGQRIVAGFEEIVGEPTRVLAWNLFRRARTQGKGTSGFGPLSELFFRIQLYGAVPLFIGVAVLAHDLTVGLLGAEWAPAAPVLQILAIASLIRLPGHAAVPILSVAGSANMLPRLILIYSLITIACITVGAMFGIVTTALAEVCAAIVAFVINAVVMHRHFDIHWLRILALSWRLIPALIPALALPLLAHRFDLLADWHPLLRFFVLSLCSTLAYVPALLFLDKTLRNTLGNTLRSR